MISQYDANRLLKTNIPELALKNYPSRVSLEIYASVNYFTDYTKQSLKAHNFEQAKKCFGLAESLYINGDGMVRLLIEDSFIYGVSSVMADYSRNMFMMKSILPNTLYNVYKKHLLRLN